jgi:rhodanese-like protein
MYTPSTVTSAELKELLKRDSGPRMIDVRTPAEFETVHIPGAYKVPLDLLREHRDEIATHVDDDVELAFRSGQRAETRHRTQRWDLKSQVRLVAGSLVLGGALRSIAAQTLRWIAASKAR